MKQLIAAAIICNIVIYIIGCSPDTTLKTSENNEKATLIRISVLPDQDETAMRARYTPLFEHIKKETGYEYKFIIPKSYNDALNLFIKKEIDLALFGGVTFVRANEKAGAVPLVLRDIDEKFSSIIVVNPENPAKSLSDLKGSRFMFGSKLSTSGHLMPRYFMNLNDIKPEKFFETVGFSGAHDKTILSVINGHSDAGVANSKIIEEMLSDGRIHKNKIRVLWESPTYTDYVWAVQENMDITSREKLINAFLSLTLYKPETRTILESVKANYYLPASIENFQQLRQIVLKTNI